MKYRIINIYNSLSAVSIIINLIYQSHPPHNSAREKWAGVEEELDIITIIISVFPMTCFSYHL